MPLTALVADFGQWTRRIEWLLDTARFMEADADGCHAADLINRLRTHAQSGYRDVADAALSLLTAAETAWLKHVAAWFLYGRLPTPGSADFFVQLSQPPDEVARAPALLSPSPSLSTPTLTARQDFVCLPRRLPSFVTPATAASMLYIGKLLHRVGLAGHGSCGFGTSAHVSSKLRQLASLSFPLDAATLSRAVASIRLSLSEHTLSKLLPPHRVLETLQLLRDFLLLGRGEFALALAREADDKMRNRWRRAGNLAHQRDDGLENVTVRDGEVAAVLCRTWAALASLQARHADDEQLELARDLLRLRLTPSPTPWLPGAASSDLARRLEPLPFRNLLLSVPAVLSVELPSPLDMVISPAQLQIYACINSYLLSLRRAHMRLTDLWKMTCLRRHHAAPAGAGEAAVALRKRWSARSTARRGSWTTASAAVFFLGETEGYLQTEVVADTWETFSAWLTGHDGRRDGRGGGPPGAPKPAGDPDDEDLFLPDEASSRGSEADAAGSQAPRDPQAIEKAHGLFLDTLAHRLMLTHMSFTEPLYALLTHIDQLVLHMRRLHSIFVSMDLEADAGVVDASVDLEQEQAEVVALLRMVEAKVQRGIEAAMEALRALEADEEFLAACEAEGAKADDTDDADEASAGDRYAPGKVGGVDRLLMKLDFGAWLGSRHDEQERDE